VGGILVGVDGTEVEVKDGLGPQPLVARARQITTRNSRVGLLILHHQPVDRRR